MILPLLATLAFWCALAVGVHRVLSKSPEIEQAADSGPPVSAGEQSRAMSLK